MGFNETTGGNCVFCYSHSSYFAEVLEPYFRNELREFIDLKGNVVEERNRVKNDYRERFNEIWFPADSNKNPSLPKIINPEVGDK